MGRRAANVEKFTKQGVEELQNGNLNKALEEFEAALKYAEKLRDGFAIRTCAFNLGAIYIALKQSNNGLAMLQKAIPPNGTKDGKSNGDLFYNFGLGYETMRKNDDAVKYFELALDEYQSESNSYAMTAEVASRVGKLYHQLKKPLLAARAYGIAAQGYKSLENIQNQASCLSYQAAALHAANKSEEALQCLDDCMILCQQIKDFNILGRLYNEIGLIYFQCKDNPQAALCFELALPLCKNDKSDREKKAVILQNLGAIFNSLGDYQRAVTLHETAAQLHAENGDRNSQGACFLNLAFSYSQLDDNEGAGECYLHALQAAKDAGDHRGQWQAMEGLGAVYFHLGKVEKSVKYYKMALATMAAAGSFPDAQERIVGKLTDALQFKLSGHGHPPRVPKLQSQYSSGTTSSTKSDPRNPSLFVNDEPRPPTRQESITRAALAVERIKGIRERQQRPFTPIALGIGMYDSESDLSVSEHGRRSKFSHRSASADRSLKKRRSQKGRMTKAMSDSDVSSISGKKLKKRYSQLHPNKSKERGEQNLMRRQERALLKNESFDDELALRTYMHGLKSSSEDDSSESSQNLKEMVKASRSVKDLDLKEKILETIVKEHAQRKSEKEKLRSGIAEVYEENHSTPPESDFGNSKRRSVRSLRRLSRHKLDDEESSSTVSVTESSEDSSTLSEDSVIQRSESSPPHSKSPTPPPPPKPLTSTYEKPVTTTPTGNVPHLSANYFNPEKKKEPKPGTSSIDGPLLRTYVQNESDPLYQTINSLKSTLNGGTQVPPLSGHSANEQSGEETEDEAPPLPARNNENTEQKEFTAMSRGERERYLYQYQQKRDLNARDPGSADMTEEDKMLLPARNLQKSRHCSLM